MSDNYQGVERNDASLYPQLDSEIPRQFLENQSSTHHNQRNGSKTRQRRPAPKQLEAQTTANGEHPLVFWDCANVELLPTVERITKLHVYDFDNTIFRSPTPNPNLYTDSTIGMLASAEEMNGGGWWCNPLVLKNVGRGWATEADCKWEGYWNDDILDLIKSSNEDENAMTILLTGRRKNFFTDLIVELLDIKGVNYDSLILKHGNFKSTLAFKCQVITDILSYYNNIVEVVIYDDRRSQLNGFQTCLNEYIDAVDPDLIYTLVPVFTPPCHLDPKTERDLVAEYVYSHNAVVESGKSAANHGRLLLRKSIFGAAYIIDSDSKALLIDWIIKEQHAVFNEAVLSSIKFQPHHIMISKTKLSKNTDAALSALSAVQWKVKSFGYKNELYAVQVEPITQTDIEIPSLTTPAILPIASYGKSQDAAIDDFRVIDQWVSVNEGIVINSVFGNLSTFKLVSNDKRQKTNKNYA